MNKSLLQLFEREYLNNGYRYSGMMPASFILNNGYSQKQINDLVNLGYIQIRDCEDYSYELTRLFRTSLLQRYNTQKKWDRKSNTYELEIKNELSEVFKYASTSSHLGFYFIAISNT